MNEYVSLCVHRDHSDDDNDDEDEDEDEEEGSHKKKKKSKKRHKQDRDRDERERQERQAFEMWKRSQNMMPPVCPSIPPTPPGTQSRSPLFCSMRRGSQHFTNPSWRTKTCYENLHGNHSTRSGPSLLIKVKVRQANISNLRLRRCKYSTAHRSKLITLLKVNKLNTSVLIKNSTVAHRVGGDRHRQTRMLASDVPCPLQTRTSSR